MEFWTVRRSSSLMQGINGTGRAASLGIELGMHWMGNAQGIVHRDHQTGNIFVTKRGHAKILIRLAKVAPAAHRNGIVGRDVEASVRRASDQSGSTLGTVAYMFRSSAKGKRMDAGRIVFHLVGCTRWPPGLCRSGVTLRH